MAFFERPLDHAHRAGEVISGMGGREEYLLSDQRAMFVSVFVRHVPHDVHARFPHVRHELFRYTIIYLVHTLYRLSIL